MVVASLLPAALLPAQSFAADFGRLDLWRAHNFDESRPPTLFIPMPASGGTALRIVSDHSVSGIVYEIPFNVRELPFLRWEWQLVDPLDRADISSLAHEDIAIQIAILFREPWEDLPLLYRIWSRRQSARLGFGSWTRALTYVWTSQPHSHEPITSLRSRRIKYIAKNHGTGLLGQRVWHEVNVLEDYRRATGREAPAEAFLAIVADSDDTADRSEAIIYSLSLHARSICHIGP